jgi:hypothetical protein
VDDICLSADEVDGLRIARVRVNVPPASARRHDLP